MVKRPLDGYGSSSIVFCVRCDSCAYSASDHNTLRRHRMRHTGHKPYRCAYCDYTAIQAISLKTHVRTKHPAAGMVAPGKGATSVYSCQACSYQTVNRRSWLGHLQDHRNNPPSVTTSAEQLFVVQKQNSEQLVNNPPSITTSAEQLFVVQKQNSGQLISNPLPITTSADQLFLIEKQKCGQLVLAPLLNVAKTVAGDPNPSVLATSEFPQTVTDGVTSQPDK